MTQPIVVPALSGASQPIGVRADQNPDTSIALRSSLEIGGAAVGQPNPVPIGPAAANTVSSTPITVGGSSIQLAAAGTMTRGWSVVNTTVGGLGYVDLCWGTNAVLGQCFWRLFSGQSKSFDGMIPPAGVPLSAIASISGQTVTVTLMN